MDAADLLRFVCGVAYTLACVAFVVVLLAKLLRDADPPDPPPVP